MKRVVKIYSGVQLSSDGELTFNWNSDSMDDVLSLVAGTSGETVNKGLNIIYGYKFNDCPASSKKIVRDVLKNPSKNLVFSEDIEKFVEHGIFRLDRYFRLDNFQAKIRIKSTSTEPTLLDVMDSYLCEYCNKSEFSFQLVKETYENVSFDADKAFHAMIDAGFSTKKAQDEVKHNLDKFNELKAQGELFQMKRFIPKAIRSGFYNFLKFESQEERELYTTLQGIQVLLYDDFLTSGSTVQEAYRYIHSINPNNELTVFVLVNQN